MNANRAVTLWARSAESNSRSVARASASWLPASQQIAIEKIFRHTNSVANSGFAGAAPMQRHEVVRSRCHLCACHQPHHFANAHSSAMQQHTLSPQPPCSDRVRRTRHQAIHAPQQFSQWQTVAERAKAKIGHFGVFRTKFACVSRLREHRIAPMSRSVRRMPCESQIVSEIEPSRAPGGGASGVARDSALCSFSF